MKQRAILITGASSDVGLKIIETIASDYEVIYAHYGHTYDKLAELREKIGPQIILIKDDFSSENAGEKIINTIGKLGVYPQHIIHLPAPTLEEVRFSKINWSEFEKNINISVRSIINVLQPILKYLVKNREAGKVIFMLSSCTENIPPRFMTPYVMTKYALLGLMKSLSTEYASKEIMVNGISPGMMETKFLEKTFDHAVEANATKSPFGRNLYVEEIIPMLRFMLSDGADRITGQNIVISGGM